MIILKFYFLKKKKGKESGNKYPKAAIFGNQRNQGIFFTFLESRKDKR